MLLLTSAQSVLAFASIFVLPGAGIRALHLRLAGGRRAAAVAECCLAVAWSVFYASCVGYVLVASRTFTGARLALFCVPLAVVGAAWLVERLWMAARTGRLQSMARRRAAGVVILGAVGVPFAMPLLSPGHAPANNFNWFYWNLGRDLSAVHGIPSFVSEYGMQVRWQPDYLTLNVLLEGYRGFFAGASPAVALDMWKLPLVGFALLAVYVTLRLWVGRPAAILGTAALAVTQLGTAKLGNGRPEALGFALALFAVVLGVNALRERRPGLYVVAGGLLGVTASVHAIGALVAGLLLVGATMCEVAGGPPSSARARLQSAWMAISGAVTAGVIVAATGFALQGRVFVGSDAGRPDLRSGVDETHRYFELTESAIGSPLHILAERLSGVTPSISLQHGIGLALLAWAAVGVVVGLLIGTRRQRQAVIVALVLAGTLAGGIAWFMLRYDTFVPRNTGQSRLAQWMLLAVILLWTVSIDVVTSSSWAARLRGMVASRRGAPAIVVGATAVLLSLLVASQFPPRIAMTADATRALAALGEMARPGDVVVSNAITHGQFEFLTDVEAPLEGRQPVMEDPAFLRAANDYVQEAADYFTGVEPTFPERHKVRWVVRSFRVRDFGAISRLGPPSPIEDHSLQPVWHAPYITIYRAGPHTAAPSVGPAQSHVGRLLVGFAVVMATLGALAMVGRRRRRSAPVPPLDVDDQAHSQLPAMVRGRSAIAVAWVSSAIGLVILAGLPGTVATWFTGDLAYHLGVAHSMARGSLVGQGPYAGLPAYFGGLFPMTLGAVEAIGISAEKFLSVVSWFEPLLWLACLWRLGRTLWPGRPWAHLAFALTATLCAGFGGRKADLWVNAPNIAGQVFWPLFPRDVALLLGILVVDSALRRAWVWTGVLAGLAVATQAQIGAVVCVLAAGILLVRGSGTRRWLPPFGALALAAIVSSWWWIPRVVWTLRWGLDVRNGTLYADVDHSPLAPWLAYGPMLAVAGLGAILAMRRSRGRTESAVLLWLALAGGMVTVALVAPSEAVALRRALLLSGLPLAAAATYAAVRTAASERMQVRVAAALAGCLVVVPVVASVPTLLRDGGTARAAFADQSFGHFGYADAAWGRIWRALERRQGPVLVSAGDASIAWFRTGLPVLYMSRPGYVKAGFDIPRATGWSEAARRTAVDTAWAGGPDALCRLARQKRVSSVLFRAETGLLGVIDRSASSELDDATLLTSKNGVRGPVGVWSVAPGATRTVPTAGLPVKQLSVWALVSTFNRPKLSMIVGGETLTPRLSIGRDAMRADFDLDPHPMPAFLTVRNDGNRPVRMLRAVAYVPDQRVNAPAAVLSPSEVCALAQR